MGMSAAEYLIDGLAGAKPASTAASIVFASSNGSLPSCHCAKAELEVETALDRAELRRSAKFTRLSESEGNSCPTASASRISLEISVAVRAL